MPSPAGKPVRIYAPIRGVIRGWPAAVKKELAAILTRLQKGNRSKKTQKTPKHEIEVGRARLRRFLIDLENEDE